MFQSDSESDSEGDAGQIPSIHHFIMNKKSGFNHTTFDRPPLKTPFRPKGIIPSSTSTSSSSSSSSSSSTTTSIFDKDLTRPTTPLTSPVPETPESSRLRLSSHGKLSASSFVERCVDTSDIPLATPSPATTSTAKQPSQYLSDSDYELLVEGVKKLGIQYHEQASNTRVSLGLDNSPVPAERPQLKQGSPHSVRGDDAYFQSPMKNRVSNRNNKLKNTSPIDKTPLAMPKVRSSSNIAGARGTPQSSTRRSADTPSLVIAQVDDEGENVDADNCGATAQNPPHPVLYRQKATLSVPRASHKRSASAPGPRNKSSVITQDTPIVSASSRNASWTQTNKVDAPASLAPTRCTGRRRSTSSVVPEHTILPPIASSKSSSPRDHEGVPGAFLNKLINSPEFSHQKPSSELPKKTPDLHPDETSKFPKLEDMYTEKMNKNDLKNEILHVIRRQKAKSVAVSTLKYGCVYIFKSDRYPGHVKIGSTVDTPTKRRTQWETKCKFKAIPVTDENDKAFRFCRIVEQIVHAELYNERRKFYCDACKMKHVLKIAEERSPGAGGSELDVRPTEHGEWFEISETKALEVVNKWRHWMIHQEPYKENAMIRSCWAWKYDIGMKWMKGSEAEWEVWRQFGSLDIFQFCWYDLNKWLGKAWPLLLDFSSSLGSVFALLASFYFWTAGVNWLSSLKVAIALFLCLCLRFKYS